MENTYKNKSRAIFIGLGGNKGDRLSSLRQAAQLLYDTFPESFTVSPVYETPAWGFESDQDFLNCCVGFKSSVKPEELLRICAAIENELGRERLKGAGYSSRSMDLDILYIGKEVIATNDLTVPHPRITQRNFVLYPLCDIAANFEDPVFKKSIKELKADCNDESGILLYTNNLLTFL